MDSLKDVENHLNFSSKISKMYYQNFINNQKKPQKEDLNRINIT